MTVSVGGGIPVLQAFFGPGLHRIFFDNVECSGNESSLFDCPRNGFGRHDCDHIEDAGVICIGQHPVHILSTYVSDSEIFPHYNFGLYCTRVTSVTAQVAPMES